MKASVEFQGSGEMLPNWGFAASRLPPFSLLERFDALLGHPTVVNL
jgi:hypothetical protein